MSYVNCQKTRVQDDIFNFLVLSDQQCKIIQFTLKYDDDKANLH